MDEQSIITQCPECSTQFRVTAGQLKVANRQVRCGACLNVFCATSHQITPEEPAAKPAPQPPKSIKKKQYKQNDTTQQETAQASKKQIKKTTSAEPAPKQIQNIPASRSAPQQKTEERKTPADSPDSNTPVSSSSDNKAFDNNDIPTLTFKAEPLTLHTEKTNPKFFQTGWFLACLMTLSGLFCQYLWFNRAELYWNKSYQPIYASICNHLDCQIPPPQNLEQIQNQQLLVTPHKQYEDAVEMKLMLLNTAEFPQPYPALRLIFSDLKGRTIAQRDLEPAEYLDNEAVDLLSMPSQQPIQVSLELMSPGHRAVSYQLELLAPAP